MALKKCVLKIEVEYDDDVTDPESLASAADILLNTDLSTDGILDDYGSDEHGTPGFSEFLVLEGESSQIDDEQQAETVTCCFCSKEVPKATAHQHRGQWVGDECCWDERLRSSE